MIYKRIIIFLIGLLFVISGIFFYLNSPPELMQDEIMYIKKGATIKSVARELKGRNLITNEKFFILLAVSGKTTIINGKYKIFKGMTSTEILGRFSRGEILRRKITIPEGFNIYEIATRLESNEISKYRDFIYYAFDSKFLKSLKISNSSIEGYIFPDTYIFAEESDPRDVIIIMYNRLKGILKSIDRSNLKKLNLNIHQLINLSSLIEKEAKIPSERRYISAVFHNRLRKGIKLGCDPTVRYAVKKFDGRIRYRDLRYNSPYNTYVYTGLPPTPICSPGKKSIIAALNPVKTRYLYFVARNDGSHYFSKSLKEHNRAVEFYQKGINNGFVDKQQL